MKAFSRIEVRQLRPHFEPAVRNHAQPAPVSIRDNEDRLDDLLSEPTPAVVETMRRLEGDIMVLGVSGKMGPTLARMAKRASADAGVRRRVIGVARFTAGGEEPLWTHGMTRSSSSVMFTYSTGPSAGPSPPIRLAFPGAANIESAAPMNA